VIRKLSEQGRGTGSRTGDIAKWSFDSDEEISQLLTKGSHPMLTGYLL